jgi:hypothetical protein
VEWHTKVCRIVFGRIVWDNLFIICLICPLAVVDYMYIDMIAIIRMINMLFCFYLFLKAFDAFKS